MPLTFLGVEASLQNAKLTVSLLGLLFEHGFLYQLLGEQVIKTVLQQEEGPRGVEMLELLELLLAGLQGALPSS